MTLPDKSDLTGQIQQLLSSYPPSYSWVTRELETRTAVELLHVLACLERELPARTKCSALARALFGHSEEGWGAVEAVLTDAQTQTPVEYHELLNKVVIEWSHSNYSTTHLSQTFLTMISIAGFWPALLHLIDLSYDHGPKINYLSIDGLLNETSLVLENILKQALTLTADSSSISPSDLLDVRAKAAKLLGTIPTKPQSLSLMRSLLNDGDRTVRRWCAYHLSHREPATKGIASPLAEACFDDWTSYCDVPGGVFTACQGLNKLLIHQYEKDPQVRSHWQSMTNRWSELSTSTLPSNIPMARQGINFFYATFSKNSLTDFIVCDSPLTAAAVALARLTSPSESPEFSIEAKENACLVALVDSYRSQFPRWNTSDLRDSLRTIMKQPYGGPFGASCREWLRKWYLQNLPDAESIACKAIAADLKRALAPNGSNSHAGSGQDRIINELSKHDSHGQLISQWIALQKLLSVANTNSVDSFLSSACHQLLATTLYPIDGVWLIVLELLEKICSPDKFAGLTQAIGSCGGVLMLRDLCILIERPFMCTNEPTIGTTLTYRDGFTLTYWRGGYVPPEVVQEFTPLSNIENASGSPFKQVISERYLLKKIPARLRALFLSRMRPIFSEDVVNQVSRLRLTPTDEFDIWFISCVAPLDLERYLQARRQCEPEQLKRLFFQILSKMMIDGNRSDFIRERLLIEAIDTCLPAALVNVIEKYKLPLSLQGCREITFTLAAIVLRPERFALQSEVDRSTGAAHTPNDINDLRLRALRLLPGTVKEASCLVPMLKTLLHDSCKRVRNCAAGLLSTVAPASPEVKLAWTESLLSKWNTEAFGGFTHQLKSACLSRDDLPHYCARWYQQGLSCARINESKVMAALKDWYRIKELELPANIIQCASPMAAALHLLLELGLQLHETLRHSGSEGAAPSDNFGPPLRLTDNFYEQLRSTETCTPMDSWFRRWDEGPGMLHRTVKTALQKHIMQYVNPRILNALRGKPSTGHWRIAGRYYPTTAQIYSTFIEIGQQLRQPPLRNSVDLSWWFKSFWAIFESYLDGFGQFDGAWLALVDFIAGDSCRNEQLDCLINVSQNCGFIYVAPERMLPGALIIVDRPATFQLTSSNSEMFFQYLDGWAATASGEPVFPHSAEQSQSAVRSQREPEPTNRDIEEYVTGRIMEEERSLPSIEFKRMVTRSGPEVAIVYSREPRLTDIFKDTCLHIPARYRSWMTNLVCRIIDLNREVSEEMDHSYREMLLYENGLTEYDLELESSELEEMERGDREDLVHRFDKIAALINLNKHWYDQTMEAISDFLLAISEITFERALLVSLIGWHNNDLHLPWSRILRDINVCFFGREMVQILIDLLRDPLFLSEVAGSPLLKPAREPGKVQVYYHIFVYPGLPTQIVQWIRDYGGRVEDLRGLLTESDYQVRAATVSQLCLWAPDTPDLSKHVSLQIIDESRNIEIRRALINCYGQSRYIVDTGSSIIDESEYGTLYRTNIDGDEPLVMVKVVNSTPESDGSFREYFLRVPPDSTTALRAVAWTFQLDYAEYSPTIES